jgi:hypothetical protein
MWRVMAVCGVWVWGGLVLADDQPVPARNDVAALEKEFADKLTGSALVGTFSVDGRNGQPKEERYEISSAKKLQGHDWVITSRIKYGDKDVVLPVVVQVFWADDTPMISLTNRTIPGLGTFTTRVFFHGERYAGTWQHDEVGGHMWGRIEKKKPDAQAQPSDKTP